MVLILTAFALARGGLREVLAASSSGETVIGLGLVTPSSRGCQLGPAYGFCEQVPGTTGSNVEFTVQFTAAVSSVSVSLAPIAGLSANFAAGDFTISNNTCSGNFSPPQTCTFAVAFSPTATGLRQSAIHVTDAAGDTLAVNIQGIGSQLALAPPPLITTCGVATEFGSAYTYCPEDVGTVSAVQQFTLVSGSGATGVNVALTAVPGLESEFAAGDFTVENTTCTGALAGNGSCTIGVAFTPGTAGMRSAALTATDSNGDTTTIYLAGATTSGITFASSFSGFGLSNPAPCAQLNIFDFCNLPVGGVSVQSDSFTLQNDSGTQITGLSVPKGSVIAQGASAPDFAVQSSSCTSVLPANASCNVIVAFTPTTSGLRQGAIVITDAQGDVATVNLAGYGDDYNIATQLPTEITVIPGGTATFNATLTPDNVFGMNGEQVTFVCPSALPANTSCVTTPCPAAITPGTPVSVKVTFVTSSAILVAPPPTSGCSSYRPSTGATSILPPASQFPSPGARGGPARSSPLYPGILVFAAAGAIGLLAIGFAAAPIAGRRRRAALIVMCAGLAAAILTGCHHGKPAITTATTTGATNLTVSGNALDANGSSLNTSRQFQVTLDVETK